MRIDSKSNVDGIYEANLKKSSKVSENGMSKKDERNIDRVEISSAASSYDEISSIKNKIVDEVEKGTSPEKLRLLKDQIENGTYHISSKDIASALINGRSGQDTENE